MSLILTVLSAGCDRGVTSAPYAPANLPLWVAEVDRREQPPLPPLPPLRRFERVNDGAQNQPDPFSWPARDPGGVGSRPDSGRPKERLEEFSLDSLNMVGTIRDSRVLVGLVAAPDEVTYRVRPGDYLGQNDGRVTAVYPDRIELVEMVTDGAGGWLERPATVAREGQKSRRGK